MLADTLPERPGPQPWRRAPILAGVALLHVLFIFALLQAVDVRIVPLIIKREPITIWLPPSKPKIEPEKKKKEKERQKIGAPPAPIAVPDTRSDIPALQRLGHLLLDCAPENLGNLDPEDRARCARSPLALKRDDSSVDYKDHTDRSKSAALWTRRRARKNAPTLLPCANPRDPTPTLATVLCLVKGAIDGKFDLDAPGYADKPEDFHLPNGGDPPDKPSR